MVTEDCVRLFLMVHSKRKESNGYKLQKRKMRLDERKKKNSTVKVLKHWKGDQRGVESPSLDPLKTQLDEALSNHI